MEGRASMALNFKYFNGWKGADLLCPRCTWTGRIDLQRTHVYEDMFCFSCPACGRLLAAVDFPAEHEMREHWDELSEAERLHYSQRPDPVDESAIPDLSDPSQLPDIDDDPLVLVWDLERGPYTLIVHDGRTIWRERASYEGAWRFGEVVDVLKAKYGERLKDLVPTEYSRLYLFGDDWDAPAALDEFRRRMSPESLDPDLRLEALARAGDGPALGFLRYRKEIGEHALRSEGQLPAFDGGPLVFGCTIAEDPPRVRVRYTVEADGEPALQFDWDGDPGAEFLYLMVLHEGREIWREAAPQNHPGRLGGHTRALADRYEEIAAILKQKYGSRTRDLVMTYASRAYTALSLGEGAVEKARERCFPDAAAGRDGPAVQEAGQRARAHGASAAGSEPDAPASGGQRHPELPTDTPADGRHAHPRIVEMKGRLFD